MNPIIHVLISVILMATFFGCSGKKSDKSKDKKPIDVTDESLDKLVGSYSSSSGTLEISQSGDFVIKTEEKVRYQVNEKDYYADCDVLRLGSLKVLKHGETSFLQFDTDEYAVEDSSIQDRGDLDLEGSEVCEIVLDSISENVISEFEIVYLDDGVLWFELAQNFEIYTDQDYKTFDLSARNGDLYSGLFLTGERLTEEKDLTNEFLHKLSDNAFDFYERFDEDVKYPSFSIVLDPIKRMLILTSHKCAFELVGKIVVKDIETFESIRLFTVGTLNNGIIRRDIDTPATQFYANSTTLASTECSNFENDVKRNISETKLKVGVLGHNFFNPFYLQLHLNHTQYSSEGQEQPSQF